MPVTMRGGFATTGLLLLAACGGATLSPVGGGGPTAAATTPEVVLAAVAPAAGPQPSIEKSPPPRDCRRLLAAVRAGEAGAVLPVVLVDPDDPVRLDLPGLRRGAGEPGAPCLLLVDRLRAAGGSLRELGRERLEGRRPVGSRRVANPEYTRLERELAAVKRGEGRDRRTDRILATGDPALDLVGMVAETLIAGGRALFGGDRAAELEDALAATPPYIERPVYRRYRYELVRLAGERRGIARAALLDRRRGRGWTTEIRLEERRRFALARDRDPEDDVPLPPGVGELAEPAALEAWRTGPPAVPASVLLDHLAAAIDGPGQPMTPEALLAAWRETPADAAPAASAAARESPSVVVLRRGEEAVGLGFYVTPEMILTFERFLGRSVLVPVEASPGLLTYGVVEARDPERGLVLVWLPRSGPPLPLAEREAETGTPLLPVGAGGVLRAGAPLVVDGAVVGVASGEDVAATVPLTALRAFLDGSATAAPRTAASR